MGRSTLSLQTDPAAYSGWDSINIWGFTPDSYPITRHSATLAADMTTTNLDLVVTTQDLFDYLVEYFGASLYGDYDKNGSVTVQDLFGYLDAYFSAQSL